MAANPATMLIVAKKANAECQRAMIVTTGIAFGRIGKESLSRAAMLAHREPAVAVISPVQRLRRKAYAALAVPPRPRSRFDEAGWLLAAERVPSPNCDERPPGSVVSLVVIHGISLPPGEFGGDGIIRLFTNSLDAAAHPCYAPIAQLRVSAHFLIRREGVLLQFVPCRLRAWHAGLSRWRGREQCNDFSIGVELEGTDDRPYTARQYARLARVLASVRQSYPIVDIAGHSDIAPGRKSDPGPSFDWDRLHQLVPWSRRRGRPAK